MNIAAMRVRVTFQKNTVTVDKYGNHKTGWVDYFSCWATVGTSSGSESSGGVMCAIVDKKLSSEVGFKGICRKVLIFVLVGIGNVVDVQVLGQPGVLRTAIIFFYLSNEGLSLTENSAHLGLPIPEKLKAVLEQLHDRDSEEEHKHDE